MIVDLLDDFPNWSRGESEAWRSSNNQLVLYEFGPRGLKKLLPWTEEEVKSLFLALTGKSRITSLEIWGMISLEVFKQERTGCQCYSYMLQHEEEFTWGDTPFSQEWLDDSEARACELVGKLRQDFLQRFETILLPSSFFRFSSISIQSIFTQERNSKQENDFPSPIVDFQPREEEEVVEPEECLEVIDNNAMKEMSVEHELSVEHEVYSNVDDTLVNPLSAQDLYDRIVEEIIRECLDKCEVLSKGAPLGLDNRFRDFEKRVTSLVHTLKRKHIIDETSFIHGWDRRDADPDMPQFMAKDTYLQLKKLNKRENRAQGNHLMTELLSAAEERLTQFEHLLTFAIVDSDEASSDASSISSLSNEDDVVFDQESDAESSPRLLHRGRRRLDRSRRSWSPSLVIRDGQAAEYNHPTAYRSEGMQRKSKRSSEQSESELKRKGSHNSMPSLPEIRKRKRRILPEEDDSFETNHLLHGSKISSGEGVRRRSSIVPAIAHGRRRRGFHRVTFGQRSQARREFDDAMDQYLNTDPSMGISPSHPSSREEKPQRFLYLSSDLSFMKVPTAFPHDRFDIAAPPISRTNLVLPSSIAFGSIGDSIVPAFTTKSEPSTQSLVADVLPSSIKSFLPLPPSIFISRLHSQSPTSLLSHFFSTGNPAILQHYLSVVSDDYHVNLVLAEILYFTQTRPHRFAIYQVLLLAKVHPHLVGFLLAFDFLNFPSYRREEAQLEIFTLLNENSWICLKTSLEALKSNRPDVISLLLSAWQVDPLRFALSQMQFPCQSSPPSASFLFRWMELAFEVLRYFQQQQHYSSIEVSGSEEEHMWTWTKLHVLPVCFWFSSPNSSHDLLETEWIALLKSKHQTPSKFLHMLTKRCWNLFPSVSVTPTLLRAYTKASCSVTVYFFKILDRELASSVLCEKTSLSVFNVLVNSPSNFDVCVTLGEMLCLLAVHQRSIDFRFVKKMLLWVDKIVDSGVLSRKESFQLVTLLNQDALIHAPDFERVFCRLVFHSSCPWDEHEIVQFLQPLAKASPSHEILIQVAEYLVAHKFASGFSTFILLFLAPLVRQFQVPAEERMEELLKRFHKQGPSGPASQELKEICAWYTEEDTYSMALQRTEAHAVCLSFPMIHLIVSNLSMLQNVIPNDAVSILACLCMVLFVKKMDIEVEEIKSFFQHHAAEEGFFISLGRIALSMGWDPDDVYTLMHCK